MEAWLTFVWIEKNLKGEGAEILFAPIEAQEGTRYFGRRRKEVHDSVHHRLPEGKRTIFH